MESFEEILTAGGHSNSLGRAGEVLEVVRGNHSRLDELFTCISADDAWVRMRAIDTFEKLVKDRPELVRPYLEPIFSDLTKSTQPSIQWHLAQIFGEVLLSDSQRNQAVAWLEQHIKSTDVDWIVSVNVMKTLLGFCKNGYISSDELEPLFKMQTNHASKTVYKKAGIFLHELAGND
ncbi:MAG TPA: hypothetical protein VLH38_00260 [Patescibacteria group bacterium]|nr:hypothetical protein [Patescibacteria group bacterium]